jgi:hypothetical protein
MKIRTNLKAGSKPPQQEIDAIVLAKPPQQQIDAA